MRGEHTPTNRIWKGKMTSFVRTGLRSTLLGGISVAALLAAPAMAQDAPETLETVTVTGSRVITDLTVSPTPITELSAQQLLATTPSDIPDALNKLPTIIGGHTPRKQGNGSGNGSGNTLSLRNFGATRTLVLLDGHRVPASNSEGTVDPDILPQFLMERVDIVTGGASAVYGSDAVAGVINFVLDKKFNGFKYNINGGISKYGDGAEHQAEFAYGTDLIGGRAHFETSARYRYQDMVYSKDRPYGANGQEWTQAGAGTLTNPWYDVPYARSFQQSQHGTVKCNDPNSAINPCAYQNYTFNQAGVLSPLVHGTSTATANMESGGDGGYTKNGTFRAKTRNAEWFGRFDIDVTKDIQFYVQGTASEAESFSRWMPWVVSGSSSRPNSIFANNPYLTPTTQAQLGANVVCGTAAAAGWRCLPATPPKAANGTTPAAPPSVPYFSAASYTWQNVNGQDAPQNLYQTKGLVRNLNVESGLSGTLAGLSWDVYYNHGESRQKVANPNNTDNAKYLAGLDAVVAPAGTVIDGVDKSGQVVCWDSIPGNGYSNLYPGCVPINIVDPAGPSQAAYNYLRTPTYFVLTQITEEVGGSIHGGLWGFGLPAGEITAALSAEARWASYDQYNNGPSPTDTVNCTGLRLCLANGGAPSRWVQNTVGAVSARNNVYEFAAELNIPLLKDLPLAQSVSADVAARHTNYSTFGGVDTWKIGGDWHLDDNVHFRSTMSFDIRAPNLYDLNQPITIGNSGFTDQLTGVSDNTHLVIRGNPNLVPEQAHTYTVGTVLTPTFLPNFSLSVDWYMTHMSKAITNVSYFDASTQAVCLASAPSYSSQFCSLAVRPITDPNDPNFRKPANYPTEIWQAPLNASTLAMEGLDVEVNYRFGLGDYGDVVMKHMMTYEPVNTTYNIPGALPTWGFSPKLRQTTFVTYNYDTFTLAVQNQLLGSVKKATSPGQYFVRPSLGSNDITDVTISDHFELWGAANEVYLSINNIANTRAPLYTNGTAGLPGLFYPTADFHDDMGRYFTLGIKGNF
jgi:outer membrane receptor protein involved in Fe transport